MQQKSITTETETLSNILGNITDSLRFSIKKKGGEYHAYKDEEIYDNEAIVIIGLLSEVVGSRQIAEAIEGVNNHTYIAQYRKFHDIAFNRFFYTKKQRGRERKNYHIHPKWAKFCMDGKGMVNGSIADKHHGRSYILFEDKVVKLIVLRNLETDEYVWLHIDQRSENKSLQIQTLQKGLMVHNWDYRDAVIIVDRATNIGSDEDELKGTKFVAYGKGFNIIKCPLLHHTLYEPTTHIKDKSERETAIREVVETIEELAKEYNLKRDDVIKEHIYNSMIEQCFSALSNTQYDTDILEDVETHAEAKEAVDAILHNYWNHNAEPLIQYMVKKRLMQTVSILSEVKSVKSV